MNNRRRKNNKVRNAKKERKQEYQDESKEKEKNVMVYADEASSDGVVNDMGDNGG